jgi:threonine/homoserine/homoserine lactone efflux protein
MEQLEIFLKGLAVGLVIAVPVGPVGIWCVHRSLTAGPKAGLIAGFGAAVADALYACVAAFGLAALSNFIVAHRPGITIGGGILIALFAVKIFFSKRKRDQEGSSSRVMIISFWTMFLMTLTNPVTLLALLGMLAVMGLESLAASYLNAGILVAGVFFGSMIWWALLSLGAGSFLSRMPIGILGWLNRVVGVLLFIFGILVVLQGILLNRGT